MVDPFVSQRLENRLILTLFVTATMTAAVTAAMTTMTTMMKEKDVVAGGQGCNHEKCEDENRESTQHETPPIVLRYQNFLFIIHRNP